MHLNKFWRVSVIQLRVSPGIQFEWELEQVNGYINSNAGNNFARQCRRWSSAEVGSQNKNLVQTWDYDWIRLVVFSYKYMALVKALEKGIGTKCRYEHPKKSSFDCLDDFKFNININKI